MRPGRFRLAKAQQAFAPVQGMIHRFSGVANTGTKRLLCTHKL